MSFVHLWEYRYEIGHFPVQSDRRFRAEKLNIRNQFTDLRMFVNQTG